MRSDQAQATHTGKVVVARPQPLGANGTVAVLGGLGGLGSLIARWMVDSCGVREVVLLSRSGRTRQSLPAATTSNTSASW
jgi:predicted amino acid dehydrogenase